jgi:methylated-DNA-[protein]-cysteine S-methyltransferase
MSVTIGQGRKAPGADYELDIRAGRIREGMNFSQKVWALTARIPAGKVTTYGEIARRLGSRGARAVGFAMNRNPYAPAVPCHRVVGSAGHLTGFAGGLPKKRRMLEEEGVRFDGERADVSAIFVFGKD